MLNLSSHRIVSEILAFNPRSTKRVDLPSALRMFTFFMVTALAMFVIILFLPWVQNFRAKGKVTALNPGSRPQEVQATIPGRIEEWFVFEGDTISRGDTIARLSETKADYLDPEVASRAGEARAAKSSSAAGYLAKAQALAQQSQTLQETKRLKLESARQKLEQATISVATAQADLKRQQAELDIARYQAERTDSLYQKGLKALVDLEAKRVKLQEAQAKLTSVTNKLAQSRNKVQLAKIELESVGPEYDGKIAKNESDRQSALTAYYSTTSDVAKLASQEANYQLRKNFAYITAPQDGIVAKLLTAGLGETVKEGKAIATILPATFTPAVEMYVEPFNLPLVKKGHTVRFLFDGWPSIVFSGWPGLSYGTFTGEIVAIDNIISQNGKYRVLVAAADNSEKPWPAALRPGSGAQGVVMLGEVTIGYEIWRQLNAFPPNYYETLEKYDEKATDFKRKAPAKTVVK